MFDTGWGGDVCVEFIIPFGTVELANIFQRFSFFKHFWFSISIEVS